MHNQILVPLKKHDRLEEIVPYIEKVARPGTSVVFLIRAPVGEFRWLQAYSTIAQCGLEKSVTVRRMIESYSLKMRRQLIERRVFQTCGNLHDMALNIAVDVYTESLQKVLTGYTSSGDAALVIMQPGIAQRIAGFLNGSNSLLALFKRQAVSPVLLIHPGMAA